ncbi:uncharacterized protein MJAP1_004289 [Malassezia japonica]|uniref:RRM domain-containing protein n=1 Tax=Malassezia japonica TaxID=223818 RepID=A0AAF0JBX2_9BASI|nr:uncharacterized protein MJAP1_004289 [Malassezia japonica]WFD41292.1 hypothetical protein MJAP1_004289 [Malassezia japonica]
MSGFQDSDMYRSRKRYSHEGDFESEKRYRRDFDGPHDRDDRFRGRRDDPPRRRDEFRGGGGRRFGPRMSPPPPGTKRLTERVRARTLWDIIPKGFEETDPISAKATGFFGAPVNSSVAAITAEGLDETVPPSVLQSRMDPLLAAALYNAKKHQKLRRLDVSGITTDMSDATLRDFFNQTMTEKKIVASLGTEPCLRAEVYPERNYAMVEFRHPDDATNAMFLEGTEFQRSALHLERPDDYSGTDTSYATIRSLHTTVPDGPNKLYVGSIPTFLNADQVTELLKAFGELRHFDLLLDRAGNSRGIAFCEFFDETMTHIACEGLNGLLVGEQRLVVKRAMPEQDEEEDVQETSETPTKAMTMLNMVAPEELEDDQEYQDILEDVREECVKYGTITDVRIPRPYSTMQSEASRSWKERLDANPGAGAAKERRGVGRVYVQYATEAQCTAALQAIAGRQFGGRMVICAYIRDEAWPDEEDGANPNDQQLDK